MNIDPMYFQKSITEELRSVQNRVRNLIGNANWGEDGRYKEAILRKVIRRFIPSYLSIGTGFVVDLKRDFKVSKQIDILIYDNRIPPLFTEGDFVITTPINVRAVIEVKSSFRWNILRDAIEKAKYNGEIIVEGIRSREGRDIIHEETKPVFNGIFFYDARSLRRRAENDKLRFKEALGHSEGYVSHLALGPHYFVRRWEREYAEYQGTRRYLLGDNECRNQFYNVYYIENLAFSYFISNLLNSLLGDKIAIDRDWFLYPIPEGKEAHRLFSICLED